MFFKEIKLLWEPHPIICQYPLINYLFKTQGANFSEEQRFNILQPTLEINPEHPIIKKLQDLKTSNPKLATLVTEQLFANAMVSAGLVDDPRTILKSMNEMMALALEKHWKKIKPNCPFYFLPNMILFLSCNFLIYADTYWIIMVLSKLVVTTMYIL